MVVLTATVNYYSSQKRSGQHTVNAVRNRKGGTGTWAIVDTQHTGPRVSERVRTLPRGSAPGWKPERGNGEGSDDDGISWNTEGATGEAGACAMGGNDGKWTSVSTAARPAAAAGLVQWVGRRGYINPAKTGHLGCQPAPGAPVVFSCAVSRCRPAGDVAFVFGFVGSR